tara:strand:- start:232 stop:741 length:510 start_codon:yes stop_codon:yes gene_type:complete
MINYEVGQVVYLLSQKTLNIVPALIVEEVTRKTVADSKTEYVVEMPNEKGTRAKLSAVTSMIFSDITDLREHMLENTRRSVEKLISDAINLKDVKFGGNYIDSGISDRKSSEVLEVFKKDKDIEQIPEKPVMIKTDQFKPKEEKLMQNNVKDVIMNGNINSNNTKQQEK